MIPTIKTLSEALQKLYPNASPDAAIRINTPRGVGLVLGAILIDLGDGSVELNMAIEWDGPCPAIEEWRINHGEAIRRGFLQGVPEADCAEGRCVPVAHVKERSND